MPQAHGLHKLKMLRKLDGFGVVLEVRNMRKRRCHLITEALQAMYQLVFRLIYLLKLIQFTPNLYITSLVLNFWYQFF